MSETVYTHSHKHSAVAAVAARARLYRYAIAPAVHHLRGRCNFISGTDFKSDGDGSVERQQHRQRRCARRLETLCGPSAAHNMYSRSNFGNQIIKSKLNAHRMWPQFALCSPRTRDIDVRRNGCCCCCRCCTQSTCAHAFVVQSTDIICTCICTNCV